MCNATLIRLIGSCGSVAILLLVTYLTMMSGSCVAMLPVMLNENVFYTIS